MSKIHIIRLDVRHFDRFGNLKWEALGLKNLLHDEGEQALLSAYFATAYSGYGPPPANLYIGLDNRVSLAEGDILTSLSGEPVGNGYARIAVSTAGTGVGGQDFVISQPGAYYQALSKTVTFTATGSAWSAVRNCFLCTVASGTVGKLICSLALTAIRTLQVGDSLQNSMLAGMSE